MFLKDRAGRCRRAQFDDVALELHLSGGIERDSAASHKGQR